MIVVASRATVPSGVRCAVCGVRCAVCGVRSNMGAEEFTALLFAGLSGRWNCPRALPTELERSVFEESLKHRKRSRGLVGRHLVA
jgi:hypothetical protein